MKNIFLDTEVGYIMTFSKKIVYDKYIRFIDDLLPDMYAFNGIFITDSLDEKTIESIISKEINYSIKNNRKFLKIESFNFNNMKNINNLIKSTCFDLSEVLSIKTSKYRELTGNTNCKILKADNHKVISDAIQVDILANQNHMGVEFATRRVNRKALIYEDDQVTLDIYVCYLGDRAIGNCEMYTNGGIAKIEDFDILEEYQRQGYGTMFIKKLLEICDESGVEIAYVVTDKKDTPREMYYKCGFQKETEKYEILVFL